jgi:hypothetical protein
MEDLIVLPKKIEKRLKEESEKTGAQEEEIIIEALSKASMTPKLFSFFCN